MYFFNSFNPIRQLPCKSSSTTSFYPLFTFILSSHVLIANGFALHQRPSIIPPSYSVYPRHYRSTYFPAPSNCLTYFLIFTSLYPLLICCWPSSFSSNSQPQPAPKPIPSLRPPALLLLRSNFQASLPTLTGYYRLPRAAYRTQPIHTSPWLPSPTTGRHFPRESDAH